MSKFRYFAWSGSHPFPLFYLFESGIKRSIERTTGTELLLDNKLHRWINGGERYSNHSDNSSIGSNKSSTSNLDVAFYNSSKRVFNSIYEAVRTKR